MWIYCSPLAQAGACPWSARAPPQARDVTEHGQPSRARRALRDEGRLLWEENEAKAAEGTERGHNVAEGIGIVLGGWGKENPRAVQNEVPESHAATGSVAWLTGEE